MNGNLSLFKFFLSTFKIGAFTFGGGWAMIPLVREELVKKRKWMCEEEFMDVLSIAQGFPGPIMVNVSVMCGKCLLGWRGALTGLLGAVLPSLLAILFIVSMLTKYGESHYVRSFLNGMRPALFAVLIYALFGMRKSATGSKISLGIAVLAFIALSIFKLNPFIVIAGGAIFGLIFCLLRRKA